MEVSVLATHKSNKDNRGAVASSVNPQGHSKDPGIENEPKTELENRAKKRNTKT
jgi:small acid-soluble spore protein L (minor)